MKKFLINLYESIYSSEFVLSIIYHLKYSTDSINVMNTKKTLKYINNNDCSVARFGEGELELILDSDKNLGFQQHSIEISDSLKEVLKNTNSNLLICIPYALKSISNGRTKHSRMFWYNWSSENDHHHRVSMLLNETVGNSYLFGDTQMSRPYIAYRKSKKSREYFDLLKKIWLDKDILIIEGESTRIGIGNDLLSDANSIKRILCPATNAFDYINEIFDKTIAIWNGEIIILALGPTATILASKFCDYNIRAIDLGHLDIEYEWFVRKAKNHDIIPGKYTNEAEKGNIVDNCIDQNYLSQVILRIGC